MSDKSFKIGTRGSPLALKQAETLRAALESAHPALKIEVVPIKSAADWRPKDPEKALDTQNGGKGQFAKEIEERILEGSLDCGVHSLKDMASFLPEGLVIEHYMERVDPRDAFISKRYQNVSDMPKGASIGTCSPRRQALALMKGADLEVLPFRGNVKTRLDKIEAGQVDATFLAMAGLTRLGIDDPMIHPVSIEDMIPACGQGVVCMEYREGDERAKTILNAAHHVPTALCAVAEREVLKVMDGSCHTPISAFAVLEGDEVFLRALVASLDGQEVYTEEMRNPCQTTAQAMEIGLRVGQALKSRLPEGFLD